MAKEFTFFPGIQEQSRTQGMPHCSGAVGTDPAVSYSHPQQRCDLEDHVTAAVSHRPHLLVNKTEARCHPWQKLEKRVWKSSIFPGNLEIFLAECPEEHKLILIEKKKNQTTPQWQEISKLFMEIKKKKVKLNLRAGLCYKWVHWSSPICVWRQTHCSLYLLCSWPRIPAGELGVVLGRTEMIAAVWEVAVS